MRGCFAPVDPQFTQRFGSIAFNSVKNPFARRATDLFRVTVYKEYDDATFVLSKEIMRASTSFIPKETFDTNIVESIVVTADNMIV